MKKWICSALAAVMLILLTGCAETSADDLYQLPQLSEGYLRLQGAIDEVLSSGAVYAAPSAGANRQPIQREDLDGDGVREVLAFFNVSGSDRPLKIIIFRNEDDRYYEIARIEGEGSGIESVAYLDMDSDGVREVAVGWQMAAGISMLSVYSLKGWQVNQIVNTNYSEFTVCNIDESQGSEILVLRLSASEMSGEAEHYAMTADGEIVNFRARLSSGVEALLRVRTTDLLGGSSAVLVESTINGSGIVTDIFVHRNGKLSNITMDESAGFSVRTVRSYGAYCRDVNGDGVLDVPHPVALPVTSENTTYYMLEWYAYYGYGGSRQVATTYNNYADAWYLSLPRDWIGHIAVRREDGIAGERTIIFSTIDKNGGRDVDFLAIYTFTGENRAERAASGGRFVLLNGDTTVYSAKLLAEESQIALPISREMLIENFGIIYSEWVTGET